MTIYKLDITPITPSVHCQFPGGKLKDAELYSLERPAVCLQTKHLHVGFSL